MIERRKALIGVMLAAVAAVTWWLTQNPASPLPMVDPRSRHEPDYIVENYLATAMNELGKRKYQLRALRLTHYPDDDTSHVIEPELTQYADGAVRFVARADTGVIPGDGSEIVMRGNVKLRHTGDADIPGAESTADIMKFKLLR